MIQFRQIEAFRCLMIAGTSVGAARKMNITQPAISRLIADLESALGFRLFNRDKGRLEPTLAGVRFYSAVEENFLGLERLTQVASNIRNEAPEGITIACLPVLSTTILPLILRQFFKHHPDVPVTVDSCNTPEILMRLQNLKVDIAICMAFPPLAGMEQETIKEVSVMCGLPEGHRLADKEMIDPMDLDGENIIGFLPIISQSYELEKIRLDETGTRPRHRVKTQTSHTRYAMVANGLGISIVEPFGAKVWRSNGVIVRPFASDIRHQYVLAYPSGGKRSELMHDFRELALDVAKDYDFGFDA
ncbi:DNA-binding transcriptional LysR family regulator [Undibacterium sp. GrIS 1.8]|uniref:LysR substrate-binding domain-containing protein n=1 Tax=unclassified Undibacterium TaxID=2630295 RepID=UPI003392B65D